MEVFPVQHKTSFRDRSRQYDLGSLLYDTADMSVDPDSLVGSRGRATHRYLTNNILEGTYSPHHSPPGQIRCANQIAQDLGLLDRPDTTRIYDGTTSRTGAPTRHGRTDWIGTDRGHELAVRLDRPSRRAASPRSNRIVSVTVVDTDSLPVLFLPNSLNSVRDAEQESLPIPELHSRPVGPPAAPMHQAPPPPPPPSRVRIEKSRPIRAADFSHDIYFLPATDHQSTQTQGTHIFRDRFPSPTTTCEQSKTRAPIRSHTVSNSARSKPEPTLVRRGATRKTPRRALRPRTPPLPQCAHCDNKSGPMHAVRQKEPEPAVKRKMSGLRRLFSFSRKAR